MPKKKKPNRLSLELAAGTIHTGESADFSCDRCGVDYRVTLEPEKPDDFVSAKVPLFCPFCGGDDVVPG